MHSVLCVHDVLIPHWRVTAKVATVYISSLGVIWWIPWLVSGKESGHMNILHQSLLGIEGPAG